MLTMLMNTNIPLGITKRQMNLSANHEITSLHSKTLGTHPAKAIPMSKFYFHCFVAEEVTSNTNKILTNESFGLLSQTSSKCLHKTLVF